MSEIPGSTGRARREQDTAALVVAALREKGVRLWLENGQVRFRAPEGTLTGDDIGRLRHKKDDLVAFLGHEAGMAAQLPTVQQLPRAPLAFSQLVHWNTHTLWDRPAIRQVASVLRLAGRLDIDVLQRATEEIVRRHDALRTRIVVSGEQPMQQVRSAPEFKWTVRGLSESRSELQHLQVQELVRRVILEPTDISGDPLLALQLLETGPDEHVLIVAIEHIISDAFSLSIFERELLTSYAQILDRSTVSLPPVSLQFHAYAARQRATHQSWLKSHGDYWARCQSIFKRLRFPSERPTDEFSRTKWAAVRVTIGPKLKGDLSAWCRSTRTTLPICVFAAYAVLVLRWCDAAAGVFRFQTDGRWHANMHDAIGYFASGLYVYLHIGGQQSFRDLIQQAMEQYCLALEHADSGYIEATVPNSEFTRTVGFNWVPHAEACISSTPDLRDGALNVSRVPFEHPMTSILEIDHEPDLLLFEHEHAIAGELYFPLDRLTTGAMERFTRNLVWILEELIRAPAIRITDLRLIPQNVEIV